MRALRCSVAPSIRTTWPPNPSLSCPAVPLDVATFAVAFGIALVVYPVAIRPLERLRAGQVIQAELPDSHQRKAGTPTGGGILFAVLGIVGGLLATLAGHAGAWPAVGGLVAGGLIGFADDRSKPRVGSRGIPARLKLPIQVLLAIPVAYFALSVGGSPSMALAPSGSTHEYPPPSTPCPPFPV